MPKAALPRRAVSIHLPFWPTDRLRRGMGNGAPPADRPLVTAAREGSRRLIASADAAARRAGLLPGMTLARARALVPGLAIAEAEPERDLEALLRLAEWMLARYSPLVAPDPPDGLFIDATGCTHLWPDETAMLSDLVARLERNGMTARAAMAGTWGAAGALARFGPDAVMVLRPGTEAPALANLPVAALRLDPEMVRILSRLGFERIGQLGDVARAPLVRRFGQQVTLRLDQALGRAAEPLDPVAPHDIASARCGFAEPIGTAGQFTAAISSLAETLCQRLGNRGEGARRADLVFHRVDGGMQAIRIGTAAPTREPAHLTRLLCARLEMVDPGLGVEAMVLSVPLAEPLGSRQLAAMGEEMQEPDLSGLIDRLVNCVGAQRVYRFAPVQSEVPERSLRTLPAMAPPCHAGWPAEWPRPVRLISPPEKIDTLALLPDHPPARFTWRGRQHRVMRADGPERIFGEWWLRDKEKEAVRDYFRVEDEEGARFWLFRSGDGVDPGTGAQEWFMHGLFG